MKTKKTRDVRKNRFAMKANEQKENI